MRHLLNYKNKIIVKFRFFIREFNSMLYQYNPFETMLVLIKAHYFELRVSSEQSAVEAFTNINQIKQFS